MNAASVRAHTGAHRGKAREKGFPPAPERVFSFPVEGGLVRDIRRSVTGVPMADGKAAAERAHPSAGAAFALGRRPNRDAES